MKEKCPICRVLRGDEKNPEGEYCVDCKANQQLQADFEGWRMLRSVRSTVLMYVWLWPVFLIGVMCLDMVRSDWTALSGIFVAFAIWVASVFWLYPNQKMGRAFWKPWARAEEQKEKMFIDKLKGPSK